MQSARARVEPDEIPMVPDARERLKVGAFVLGGARGTPELDGLAGEGADADEVAWFAGGCHVGAGVVPGADGHAETEDLDLACVDGGEWAGRAEEGDDVCAAGYAAEVYGAEGAVDVFEG